MPYMQSVADFGLPFLMLSSLDNMTGVEDIEDQIVVSLTKEGATKTVTPAGTISAVPGIPGRYQVDPAAADRSAQGNLSLYATAPGCAPDFQVYFIEPDTRDQNDNGISPPLDFAV